ncbi:dihydrofolate reductase [Domibacillus epiphyticus]|uniref:Dihydrofolate reductase n=1 Tax=Domibacillus epiphyticus TaxID=1714355 RepID=A0A1V2A484_9BACI|nr:dihydrofolate reductase [Domibacillus epiphyticus]OMP65672.1 dihydrofolate reductase [Domibacillus epiphyticus]
MISFIWAQDENGLIGKDNSLPWHLPEDLKFFKKTTLGHPIVMGRKTYESIGRPLPGRENIILTGDPLYKAEGCTIVHSVEDVLDKAKNEEVFVTGGAGVFKAFLPHVDRLYVTHIHHVFEGDTYFRSIQWDDFEKGSCTPGLTDERNPYKYEFCLYHRVSQ